jgi:hypothetical protein
MRADSQHRDDEFQHYGDPYLQTLLVTALSPETNAQIRISLHINRSVAREAVLLVVDGWLGGW